MKPAMFDFKVSKHSQLDDACRAFALRHKGDLSDIAQRIGMNPQMLRNKLNPEQPHQLTLIDLLKLTDETEDPSIVDGFLEQLNCQPSVPVNQACPSNIPLYVMGATAEVGRLAADTVQGGILSKNRIADFKQSVNSAIRYLTLAGLTIQARVHTNPALSSSVDVLSGIGASFGVS